MLPTYTSSGESAWCDNFITNVLCEPSTIWSSFCELIGLSSLWTKIFFDRTPAMLYVSSPSIEFNRYEPSPNVVYGSLQVRILELLSHLVKTNIVFNSSWMKFASIILPLGTAFNVTRTCVNSPIAHVVLSIALISVTLIELVNVWWTDIPLFVRILQAPVWYIWYTFDSGISLSVGVHIKCLSSFVSLLHEISLLTPLSSAYIAGVAIDSAERTTVKVNVFLSMIGLISICVPKGSSS